MNNEKLRADIKRELNRPTSMKKLAELLNRCYVALGEQQSVPEGWQIERTGNGDIIVRAEGVGGAVVSAEGTALRQIPEVILYHLAETLLAAAPSAPAAQGWIPVGERWPDGIVLAHYRSHYGTGRTIRAQYVRPFTEEADADYDNVECCTYSEQDDCYYLKEGWYEQIDNWGDYSSVAVTEGQVTHWMPLPAAPEVKP